MVKSMGKVLNIMKMELLSIKVILLKEIGKEMVNYMIMILMGIYFFQDNLKMVLQIFQIYIESLISLNSLILIYLLIKLNN